MPKAAANMGRPGAAARVCAALLLLPSASLGIVTTLEPSGPLDQPGLGAPRGNGSNGSNETAHDFCDPNPCENGGSCTLANELRSLPRFFCKCMPGFEGEKCEINANDCVEDAICSNGGKCVDLTQGFRCQCSLGFRGEKCDEPEIWTLQQWKKAPKCEGAVWRCFRMQFNRCVDTGAVDGPENTSWYGRLQYNERNESFKIKLCYGEAWKESGRSAKNHHALHVWESSTQWEVPEEYCDCDDEFEDIPRYGKFTAQSGSLLGGLGPDKEDPFTRDPHESCHVIWRITPSRLMYSSGEHHDRLGVWHEKVTDLYCPAAAWRKAVPASIVGGLVLLFALASHERGHL